MDRRGLFHRGHRRLSVVRRNGRRAPGDPRGRRRGRGVDAADGGAPGGGEGDGARGGERGARRVTPTPAERPAERSEGDPAFRTRIYRQACVSLSPWVSLPSLA